MSYSTCEHNWPSHDNIGPCPRCMDRRVAEIDRAEGLELARKQVKRGAEQNRHLALNAERQRALEQENEALRQSDTPRQHRLAEFRLCLESARRCLDIDDLDAAAEQLRQAKGLLPAEVELFDVRALYCKALGDTEGVRAALRTAYKLDPSARRGLVLAESLSPQPAFAQLQDVLVRHPRDRSVGFALATACIQLSGKEHVAVEALVQVAPDAKVLRGLQERLRARAAGTPGGRIADLQLDEAVGRRVAEEAESSRKAEAAAQASVALKRRQEAERAEQDRRRAAEDAEERIRNEREAKRERELERQRREQVQANQRRAERAEVTKAAVAFIIAIAPGLLGVAAAALEWVGDDLVIPMLIGMPLVSFAVGAIAGAANAGGDIGTGILGGLIASFVGSFLFIGIGGFVATLIFGETDLVQGIIVGIAWCGCGIAGMGTTGS